MSRWLGRRVAKLRLHRIGIWYHQDYAAPKLAPSIQGRFEALRENMNLTELPQGSWLLDDKRLRHRDGTVVEWEPVDLVAPVSERLQAFTQSGRGR